MSKKLVWIEALAPRQLLSAETRKVIEDAPMFMSTHGVAMWLCVRDTETNELEAVEVDYVT